MGRWGTVVLAAVAATVTACSPSVADEPTSDEVATSTTRTPRITDDSGRPPVTFDPCRDIPDEVMTEAGYDAGKKEVADMPMGTYTFLGCYYQGTFSIPGELARYDLNILSGNVSLDEELEKNSHVAVPTTINGRRALVEIDPDSRDTCAYVLQSSFGVVIFNRIHHKDHPGPVPQAEWCSGLEELVSTIEPFLGV